MQYAVEKVNNNSSYLNSKNMGECVKQSKSKLKLLINSESNRVLFAEAGKDCVDFLFSILAMPVSNVVNLLRGRDQGMVGSLGNLYESVENLSETYIEGSLTKDNLLKTSSNWTISDDPSLMMILEADDDDDEDIWYQCGVCNDVKYSEDQTAVCSCNRKMVQPMKYVYGLIAEPEEKEEGGFVKGVVTYMVMDDLVVKPMSTISSLTLLSKFNIKDVGVLQEKVVDITMKEALELLKASFMSKSVLTEVFLNKSQTSFLLFG